MVPNLLPLQLNRQLPRTGRYSAMYVTADVGEPKEGIYNYYRVKSVDINGKTAYTNVVKVLMGSIKQDITIYPNPITDGMIHLQLHEPAGRQVWHTPAEQAGTGDYIQTNQSC